MDATSGAAVLLVGVGGVTGAVARYLVGKRLPTTVRTTIAVNVAGSLALGAVVATSLGDPLALALGTGFCGAFTTFSSFAVETVRLVETDQSRTAVAYATGMAIASVLALLVGGWLAGTLW